MKKILIFILIFMLSLGCQDPNSVMRIKLWYIKMINNTSSEVNLLYKFIPESLFKTEPFLRFLEYNVEKSSVQGVRIITHYDVKKLSSFISDIIILDSNNIPVINLHGEDIDNNLISIEGDGEYFLFEVREDEVGIYLNEPAIDSHLHGNDEN